MDFERLGLVIVAGGLVLLLAGQRSVRRLEKERLDSFQTFAHILYVLLCVLGHLLHIGLYGPGIGVGLLGVGDGAFDVFGDLLRIGDRVRGIRALLSAATSSLVQGVLPSALAHLIAWPGGMSGAEEATGFCAASGSAAATRTNAAKREYLCVCIFPP
jgi:hypothetical protein